jgi:signal transduction histidine kinase
MLSIPGFRGLMKTKDTKKDLEGWFTGFFAPEEPGASDMPSLLLALAKKLDLSLLALVEVEERGHAARLRAAGNQGLSCELRVPRLDGGGPIADLIAEVRPITGKARVFSTEEVFPEDASWCDLIPMDSVTAYAFVPISSMQIGMRTGGSTAPERRFFLLATEDPGSDGEPLLPVRTMLCASLLGFSLVSKAWERDRSALRILREVLKEDGYSIGFTDDSGMLQQHDDRAFEAVSPKAAERIEQQLALLKAEDREGAGKPEVFATPEMDNLKVVAYPFTAGGAGRTRMVVVKECDLASQIRNRRERLKLLSRFISTIAHEIKNPLTGISAGVQYLAKKIQPGVKEDETVEFILSEIDRLNRIVDDLYKAAKPPQLVMEQTDLNDVVGRSLICMSQDVTRKRLTVSQDLAKHLPEFEADRDRLQQVLINIIKNAIEASPEGGTIRIETFLSDHRASIRVTDEGQGISPEDREKIFEPFYSTKDRGSGLGLCISQRIVDEHGGTIRVETPESGGTCFTIELPTGR